MIVMQTIIDPVALIDRLEPDLIRERLTELDRQTRALRVLLRAAIARERRGTPVCEHQAVGDKEERPNVR
jgi:hypothetical protein